MSAPMKRHPTKQDDDILQMHHAGVIYQFPKKIAEKYRLSDKTVDADEIFAQINKKYTKPGALLHGIRIRESLTQVEMAKLLKTTQSDISQMEKGSRSIGRIMAKRIEKLFNVDYRSFLE